jgi:hypothetical protein
LGTAANVFFMIVGVRSERVKWMNIKFQVEISNQKLVIRRSLIAPKQMTVLPRTKIRNLVYGAPALKVFLSKIVSHKVHDSVDTEHWRHHQKLQILRFIPLVDDACVYTKGQGKEMSSLIVHVDNFIIAAPSDAEVSDIVTRIEGVFFPSLLKNQKSGWSGRSSWDAPEAEITMRDPLQCPRPLTSLIAKIDDWRYDRR